MDNLFTSENISMVAADALMHLETALVFKDLCAKDVTAEYNFKPNGWAQGDTINFRTDPTFEAKSFDPAVGAVTQAIRPTARALTVEEHFYIDVEVNAKQMALDFNGFSREFLKPAVYSLAKKVDTYIASKVYQGRGLFVSDDLFGATSGNAGPDLANATRVAKEMEMNDMNMYAVLNRQLEATLNGQTWFSGAENRGDDSILRSGRMGQTMGVDFYASNHWNESTFTTSSGSGTLEDAVTAAAEGYNAPGNTTLVMNEIVGGFLAGDRIEVAGATTPMIVAEDIAAALEAAPVADRTVKLVDPITDILTGGAAVTVIGSGQALSYYGALFDDQALGMAMPMLDPAPGQPSSVLGANGVTIRAVSSYDTTFMKTKLTLDCLVGAFALDPRKIVLLANY